jgi:tetratricopeptide (TPR) repeat protein
MSSESTRSARSVTERIIVVCVGTLAILIGWLLWQHARKPHRPHYLLINETSQHDFDLAFRMSLKLAEKKSGIENALILLSSLPPSRSIEETAADLFSQFKIGARRNGRGILYLYSAKENQLKVEVSYNLEGEIPDAFCHRLEQAAKTYMLSEVPQDFITELIITTNLRGMGSQDAAVELSRPSWLDNSFLSGGAGATVEGYRKTLDDYQRAIRRLPDRGLDDFLPSPDPRESVRRYLASLGAGIGDPRLPLLTEGSRIFRAVAPRNEGQQERIFEFFHAAEPYQLIFALDLCLAVPQSGKSNLPIVLRRGTDNLWYVDEPKSWTYFHRYEDSLDFLVKYGDNPFLPQLRSLGIPNMERAIYGDHVHTPPLTPYPYALIDAVKGWENRIRQAPNDATNYAALGDVYLFEMNWITRAIELYEQAAARAPSELSYRWRLVDLYQNDSRADKSLAELKFISEHLPNDKQTRDWYQFLVHDYDFDG